MSARVGATAPVDLDQVEDQLLGRLEDASVETCYPLDVMSADLRREHGLPVPSDDAE